MNEQAENEQAEMDDDGDDFPDSFGRDFAMAMDAAWLKTKDSSFAEMVREYKAVESIFTARAADNEFYVLETRRRVAESIFKSAVLDPQPFETCMACWEDVVRLGIVQIEVRTTMIWFYADCCRRNKKTEMGLNMLEPLIAELQRLLAEPNVDEGYARYYQQELKTTGMLLARLQAQRSQSQPSS